MRLGQLARKLDKKPQELIDFLEKEHKINLDSDLNTKVEGVALDLLLNTFKVEEEEGKVPVKQESVKEEVVSEPIEEIAEVLSPEIELTEEEIEDIAAKIVVEEISDEEIDIEPAQGNIEKIARVSEDGEELPELIIEDGVIKAPKPELDGFKVVGKIELPTVKRGIQFLITNSGDTTDVTEAIFEKRKIEREVRKKKAIEARKARKEKQKNKAKRKTLTEADRKAFEVKRQKRKAEEAEKLKQEKKRRHYEEHVQKKAAATGAKKKKKEIEKAVKKQKAPKQPEPTTLWGKFKKWLNT
ncbi:MAG: hypothetical protein R3279_04070 [Putridiphycobacter sp.]|nr:hypothetical protein [Putridiphycobacter sp.]